LTTVLAVHHFVLVILADLRTFVAHVSLFPVKIRWLPVTIRRIVLAWFQNELRICLGYPTQDLRVFTPKLVVVIF
jgi:hypothetical protein